MRDLAIHPRDNDLVIATHGRGIWIIDDITPLRALTAEVLAEGRGVPARPRRSCSASRRSGGWANGDAAFVGANPPDGAVITYYQRTRHIFGDLKIEVLDASGKVIGTIPSSKRRGLNRVTWAMRLPAPKVPTAATAAFGASQRPARPARHLHGDDDEGQERLHDAAAKSSPIRARNTPPPTARRSWTSPTSSTRSSAR